MKCMQIMMTGFLPTSTVMVQMRDNTSGSGNFINFDDNGTGIDSAWATSTIYDITALTNPTLELQYWIGDPAQATQEQSTLYMDIYSNGTWNNAVQTYTYSPALDFSCFDLTLIVQAIFSSDQSCWIIKLL